MDENAGKMLISPDGWYRVLIWQRIDGLFQYSNEILHNITDDFDENHLHESHYSDEFFWEWRGPQSGLFASAEQAEAGARKTVSWLQDL